MRTTDRDDPTTGTERAVFGIASAADLRALLDAYAVDRLGSPIAHVRFRAGRIDAVWGVDLADGRAVVIKGHRSPADVEVIRTARDAQRLLAAAGFPCPQPLSGPDQVAGQVLTAEMLLAGGSVPDGRRPDYRRLLADGLARHIGLLQGRSDLVHRAGPGPSWCQYAGGPWPVPHDPIVNFETTPADYEWLDAYAQRAADQILRHRHGLEVVVGHADWYAGNVAIANGVLTGSFDWELVADAEAVIAGFTAACYAASSTSGGGLSSPEEVVAFLHDFEEARGTRLAESEQRAAGGAAAWILAFNARWELGMPGSNGTGASLRLVRDRADDYLRLIW